MIDRDRWERASTPLSAAEIRKLAEYVVAMPTLLQLETLGRELNGALSLFPAMSHVGAGGTPTERWRLGRALRTALQESLGGGPLVSLEQIAGCDQLLAGELLFEIGLTIFPLSPETAVINGLARQKIEHLLNTAPAILIDAVTRIEERARQEMDAGRQRRKPDEMLDEIFLSILHAHKQAFEHPLSVSVDAEGRLCGPGGLYVSAALKAFGMPQSDAGIRKRFRRLSKKNGQRTKKA